MVIIILLILTLHSPGHDRLEHHYPIPNAQVQHV